VDSNGNCGSLMPFQSTFAVPENCCGCLLFLTPDAMQGFTYSVRSTPSGAGNTSIAHAKNPVDWLGLGDGVMLQKNNIFFGVW
jgi:hypothetical protein